MGGGFNSWGKHFLLKQYMQSCSDRAMCKTVTRLERAAYSWEIILACTELMRHAVDDVYMTTDYQTDVTIVVLYLSVSAPSGEFV